VLRRCIDEGLVGGEGSSLIQADASESRPCTETETARDPSTRLIEIV